MSKPTGMTTEQVSKWLWGASRSAAVQAHQLYCEDLFQPVYLAYARGAIVASRNPEGLALATSERMPRHLTVEQLTAWAHRLLRTCPCLPEGA